jgi:hypothetical protein
VRSTGRVVSADQCGVTLEKRFAFYDQVHLFLRWPAVLFLVHLLSSRAEHLLNCYQIHTTGMDIKHVVNATAVLTLGKDMVFRDYVQVRCLAESYGAPEGELFRGNFSQFLLELIY